MEVGKSEVKAIAFVGCSLAGDRRYAHTLPGTRFRVASDRRPGGAAEFDDAAVGDLNSDVDLSDLAALLAVCRMTCE